MPEPCLVGIRGNGGLPSDGRETSVRNRRVSRGLAPTSGQQSEPPPTTGTLSTWRRKCSVGFARVGLANPTGHFRRRVRAVAFSTEWEPPTSIQRRSARKLSFLGPRLCDGFRVCVSAELRAFPASLLSTSPPSSLRIPGSGQAEGGSSSCIGGTQHPRHRAWPPHKPQSCNSCSERTVD